MPYRAPPAEFEVNTVGLARSKAAAARSTMDNGFSDLRQKMSDPHSISEDMNNSQPNTDMSKMLLKLDEIAADIAIIKNRMGGNPTAPLRAHPLKTRGLPLDDPPAY